MKLKSIQGHILRKSQGMGNSGPESEDVSEAGFREAERNARCGTFQVLR